MARDCKRAFLAAKLRGDDPYALDMAERQRQAADAAAAREAQAAAESSGDPRRHRDGATPMIRRRAEDEAEPQVLDSRPFQVVGALVAHEVGGWRMQLRTGLPDATYLRAERLRDHATSNLSASQIGDVLTVMRDLYGDEDAVAEIGDPRFAYPELHLSDRGLEVRVPPSQRERVFMRLVAILERTEPRF